MDSHPTIPPSHHSSPGICLEGLLRPLHDLPKGPLEERHPRGVFAAVGVVGLVIQGVQAVLRIVASWKS